MPALSNLPDISFTIDRIFRILGIDLGLACNGGSCGGIYL